MTRSPRQTFVTSPLREPMEKISMSEPFLVACDYATLILAEELNDPLSPTGLAQIIGARKVLEILKNIHQKQPERSNIKPPSINYNVK
jgi:hypothetical protein